MEIVLQLLKDELELNTYARKLMKYTILLYVSYFLFSKAGGFINIKAIFDDKTNEIIWLPIIKDLLSFKAIIPFFFIFLSHSIFWIFEFLLLLLLKSWPTIWVEKQLRSIHENAMLAKSSVELDPTILKTNIQTLINLSVPTFSRQTNSLLEKLFDILSDKEAKQKLVDAKERISENLDEISPDFAEKIVIGLIFLISAISGVFAFLNISTALYFCFLALLVIYTLIQIVSIVFTAIFAQVGDIIVDILIRFVDLKKSESEF